jgi:VCBS repeat protein/List-Bact-rpt repeat protein
MRPRLQMFDSLTRSSPQSSTAFVCVPAVARVRVYEAAFDVSGQLVAFAADFEALCRPGTYTYMVGAVRFNSSRTSLEPFDGDDRLYRLNIEPPVNGRVVASGIDCGAGRHTDCSVNFTGPTDVTIQAVSGPGYEFVAWTGACKGAATTTFRVDWTRTCSAVFNPVIPGFGIEDPRTANAFFLEGAPGNPLTSGRHLFTDAAVIRPNSVQPTWTIVDVILPDGRPWSVKLRVPHDQVLRPGTYDARMFFSEPSAEPQLSVTVDRGPGCGRDMVGRFVIYEIRFDTVAGSLTLTSLAVDFEQRCTPAAPPLVGSLRYNSSYRTLTPFKTIIPPPAPPPITDFDADGSPDLVWRHRTSGRNALWLLTGTSVKSTVALTPDAAATVGDTDWEIRAAADLNGDTRPDLVWQHKSNGRLAVWFMSGASLLSASGFATLSGTSVETDLGWKIVGAGDVNRDTQTDLLWRHQLSGAVRVWHMSGLEQWDSVDVLPAVSDVHWEINGLGDLNGDGWLDIVWRHYGNGAVAAWFLRDTTLVQATHLTPASSADVNWHLVGVADLNRDGQLDLVWQHYADGRLGVWYMSGVEMLSAALLDRNVSTSLDWRIVGVR